MWTILLVMAMMFWEMPHSRLQRLSRPKMREILLEWSTHSTDSTDLVYYTKSVGSLYLRPNPLLLGLYGANDEAMAVAMIDRLEGQDSSPPVLWMLCTSPGRYESGIDLLTTFRNLTFAYTVDSRWVAEYMWHCSSEDE